MKKIFTLVIISIVACFIGNAQTVSSVTVVDIQCNAASTGVINVNTDATGFFTYELELWNGSFYTPFLVSQTAPTFPNFQITGLFAGTFQLTTYPLGNLWGS